MKILAAMMLLFLTACAGTDDRPSTGEYIDDRVITTRVNAAIMGDAGLRTSSQINVETYRGVVQLSGFVSSQEEIDQALMLAREVDGVVSVTNSMQLR